VGSPTKRPSRVGGGVSPTKSPTKKSASSSATASSLSGILGLMMDKCCPSNLAASEGLGADNMTGILIEFSKPKSADQEWHTQYIILYNFKYYNKYIILMGVCVSKKQKRKQIIV